MRLNDITYYSCVQGRDFSIGETQKILKKFPKKTLTLKEVRTLIDFMTYHHFLDSMVVQNYKQKEKLSGMIGQTSVVIDYALRQLYTIRNVNLHHLCFVKGE